jgi:hypothetical protein
LIEDIRANKLNLPAEGRALLDRRSSAFQRQEDLIYLLRPRPAAASPDGGVARVYILCDPTSPEDTSFAFELQRMIGKQERFEVALRPAEVDSFSPALVTSAY